MRGGAGREEGGRLKDKSGEKRGIGPSPPGGISLQLVEREKVGMRTEEGRERRVRKTETGICMNKPLGSKIK